MNGSQMRVAKPQVNQFNSIGTNKMPRSTFIRDYPRRQTMTTSKLVPFMLDEILPGDDLNVKLSVFARLATPIKPVMDNLYFETFWFFVPNRLVWDNWEKFQGAPINDTQYQVPVQQFPATPAGSESYLDYFGCNPYVTPTGVLLNTLPLRAMALIYREWFRDENLEPYYEIYTGNNDIGDPLIETITWDDELLTRNKRKDYITSCLPWPQKGTASGITGSVSGAFTIEAKNPVSTIGSSQGYFTDPYGSAWDVTVDVPPTVSRPIPIKSDMSATGTVDGSNIPSGDDNFPIEPYVSISTNEIANSLEIEGGDASFNLTINQLRLAAITQQILELDARGGTRYTEAVFARFGVVSPDARLQRPELIGTGHSRITVYAVPQTSESNDTPQGNLAAFGTLQSAGDHRASYAATEHGMLIGLCNVRADLTYQQKIPRYLTRTQRLDFYEPLMNGLGEQAVLNYEVQAAHASPTGVFGYQERFAEYRYRDAEICGKFRSDDPQSLDIWHLSQDLPPTVALNASFIRDAVPFERISAVPSEPPLLVDMYVGYRHTRVMPMRSNPGITRL